MNRFNPVAAGVHAKRHSASRRRGSAARTDQPGRSMLTHVKESIYYGQYFQLNIRNPKFVRIFCVTARGIIIKQTNLTEEY
jgi:hypothetical protein